MPNINIKVEGKKATLTETVDIVCGNKDYKAVFAFDAEWNAQTVKTARFVYYSGDGAKAHEVAITGNEAQVPQLLDTRFVLIGVYAGDLIVTEPAEVKCLRGILDLGGEHEEPSEDIYLQLLELLAAGEVQRGANTLSCHVDAGEATELTVAVGDITVPTGYTVKAGDLVLTADGKVFIVETATNTSAIKLKAEGIDLTLKCYEQVKRYADDNYLGALKASASGEVVRVDDVAAIEHAVAVKVRSKNIIDLSKFAASDTNTTFVNENGAITVTGYYVSAVIKNLVIGRTYTLSFNSSRTGDTGGGCAVEFRDSNNALIKGYYHTSELSKTLTLTVPENTDRMGLYLYGSNGTGNTSSATYTNIMLEPGDNVTEYTPYIDPTTVRVTRCGKNLLPPRSSTTPSGYTITANQDGSVTVTGSASTTDSIYLMLSTISDDNPLRLRQGAAYTMQGWSSNNKEISVKTVNAAGEASWTTTASWSKNLGTEFVNVAQIFIESTGHAVGDTSLCGTYRFMLEAGGEATDFETPKQSATYTPNADGTVEGVRSVGPTMTLLTDTAGVTIEAEYNQDINVIADGINSILEYVLGGVS